MTFSQMHERLRTMLLRRIQRGDLTVTLLSKQAGFGRSHVSNFLHARGQLSMQALDRILAAQHLGAEDLIALNSANPRSKRDSLPALVPVVSHASALYEPVIRPSAIQIMLQLPPGALSSARSRVLTSRRHWQRFVAVRMNHEDTRPMQPLMYDGAIAVIDRHYNSLHPHHDSRPNIYAVRSESQLVLRYAEYTATRLILRPLAITDPINLIEIDPDVSPGEYIAGRVAYIWNVV